MLILGQIAAGIGCKNGQSAAVNKKIAQHQQ
jgi:hypothetical protein